MTDLTPADLAKFIHPVPIGARFPMGLEFVNWNEQEGGYLAGPFHFGDSTWFQTAEDPPRWTAEPILAPESLAEKARAIAEEGAPGGSFDQLARLVAELAECIEAKP